MKKFLFILSAVATIFLVSCKSKDSGGGGMSDTTKKNVDAMHAISHMFETGDWSKVGDYIAADAVDHAGMSGDVKGLDSIKAMFAMMSKSMSNMKNVVVKELADDDYVMSWMKESGKMNVDMMGMKAGQDYTMNAIELSKFKDGKSTDHWSFIFTGDVMKMMPQQSSTDTKMTDQPKDSTKM